MIGFQFDHMSYVMDLFVTTINDIVLGVAKKTRT